MTERKNVLAAAAVVIIIAFAGMWPTLVNGGPFYMPDTPSYFRAAATAAFKLFHINTTWLAEYFRVYIPELASAVGASGSASYAIPVTLSGRSIYYGMLIFLAYVIGSTWIAVVIQSLLTAIAIYLTAKLLYQVQGRRLPSMIALAIGAVTVLLSSASFFIGYLMPGIFTGLGMLATANLLFLWRTQSRLEKAFWSAILAYAVLAHSTNLLLFALVSVGSVALGAWAGLRFGTRQLATLMSCLAVGVLGQAAFSHAVEASTGAPPVRPPFIAMRLIADGPGYAYLKGHCGSEAFIYCRVLSQEHPYSDELLWSTDAKVSLFRGLGPNEQRASEAQQATFVRAVVSEYPIEVLATATRNSFIQLISLNLGNFNYTPGNRKRFEDTIPPDLLRSIKLTQAWRDVMPVDLVEWTNAILVLVSCVYLFMSSRNSSHAIRAYCLCVLGAIVLNAAICGALSGPKGRYAMRLVWVLPVVAGSLIASRREALPTALGVRA